MEGDPQLPSRLEVELVRLHLDEDYDFLSATLRLTDGRMLTLDFGRDSSFARDLVDALAERLPAYVAELHAGELLLTRIAPVEEDTEEPE